MATVRTKSSIMHRWLAFSCKLTNFAHAMRPFYIGIKAGQLLRTRYIHFNYLIML